MSLYFLFVKTYYITFDIFYSTSSININSNIFTVPFSKTEINQTITYHQKLTMLKPSIQGGKVKGWDRSCFTSFIKSIHCINYSFFILYYQKSVNTCTKPMIQHILVQKFIKIFEPYKVFVHTFQLQNFWLLLSIYYSRALKRLLCKNWFYFFCLIFCEAKIPQSFRISCYWH